MSLSEAKVVIERVPIGMVSFMLGFSLSLMACAPKEISEEHVETVSDIIEETLEETP